MHEKHISEVMYLSLSSINQEVWEKIRLQKALINLLYYYLEIS